MQISGHGCVTACCSLVTNAQNTRVRPGGGNEEGGAVPACIEGLSTSSTRTLLARVCPGAAAHTAAAAAAARRVWPSLCLNGRSALLLWQDWHPASPDLCMNPQSTYNLWDWLQKLFAWQL